MSIDPELLEILVCPASHGALEEVELPETVSRMLTEKFREHFRDQEPVAKVGLLCAESQLLYPVISGIPMMLKEEVLAASVLDVDNSPADNAPQA